MTENLQIHPLSELDDRFFDQAVILFVEGFMLEIVALMKIDTEMLVDALKHSFLADHYYAALSGDKVLGILAVSTNQSRSHRFDFKILREKIGPLKGWLVYRILRKELQKPIELQANQCYIESVTTAKEARGQGVASQLIRYLFANLNYEHFVLEVVDTNENARLLYERLGFAVFDRKKASWFEKNFAGFTQRLHMKKSM